MTICSDCGKEKKHEAKGLCTTCYQHHWRETHREERAAYARRYGEHHREEIATYQRRWYEENREEILAHRRRWYEENQGERAASKRRWKEENPEKVAVIDARRQARKHSLPDTLTTEQGEHLLVIGQAMYPGEKLNLDHIVPLSKGGGTTLANMHAIPAWLNYLKHNALPQEIYIQEALL